MLYLSDYKKFPKIQTSSSSGGTLTLDSFDANLYRTIKYNLSIDNTNTNASYQCRFTLTHDSLSTMITEFDVINDGHFDINIWTEYEASTLDGSNYPTEVYIYMDIPEPTGNPIYWNLEKEVFINVSQIQKSGVDGPSVGLYPSPYTYPS